MHHANIPGVALAITDSHAVQYVATCGFANLDAQQPVKPESLFEIGSIGKSFTAIALLQLVEAGFIDLNRPLHHYLGWFQQPGGTVPITLHHLLTHTAGIPTGSDFSAEPVYEVYALQKYPHALRPGTSWHYSNLGYKALGLVLEAVLEQPYAQIITERILRPLGMTATSASITHAIRQQLAVGYADHYDDRPAPPQSPLFPATWLETNTGDGCIVATAEDMAAYIRLFLNRGDGLLNAGSFALMTSPHWQVDEANAYGYGLAIQTEQDKTYWNHGGGMVGYSSAMLISPQDDIGVIVLTNATGAPTEDFARQILHCFTNTPDSSPERQDFTRFTGTYVSETDPNRTFTISASDNELQLKFNDVEGLLYPRADNAFYADHDAFRQFLLTFEPDDQGDIARVYYGGESYRHEHTSPSPAPDYPAEWSAFTGHYRSHNPWYSNFRVVLQRGRLMLIYPSGSREQLTPLADGWFRIGEAPDSPETICFDTLLNGKTLRAIITDETYYQFFTP